VSAALTLAAPEHLDRLLPLVAAFHAEAGVEMTKEVRLAAVEPLLEGMPHGCAYLIGPPRAPIGYIVVTFGWSIEFGGLDAVIDELFVRPGVRGRGIASEALVALPRALAGAGLRAIHLEIGRDNAAALNLYRRAGFAPREKLMMMSKRL